MPTTVICLWGLFVCLFLNQVLQAIVKVCKPLQETDVNKWLSIPGNAERYEGSNVGKADGQYRSVPGSLLWSVEQTSLGSCLSRWMKWDYLNKVLVRDFRGEARLELGRILKTESLGSAVVCTENALWRCQRTLRLLMLPTDVWLYLMAGSSKWHGKQPRHCSKGPGCLKQRLNY